MKCRVFRAINRMKCRNLTLLAHSTTTTTPKHRHKRSRNSHIQIERGFSPTLSVQVRSKREKIHAHYRGGRKSSLGYSSRSQCDKGTVPLSHSELTLDRFDLQLYPLGTEVAQNIRKGPSRIQRQIENGAVALNVASRENNPALYAILGRFKHMA